MDPLKILVILGSTRQNRYGDKPAHWIRDLLAQDSRLSVELIDLREVPLPFFDQPRSPIRVTDGHYGHPVADTWATRVREADGFVIVAAEYNHGYSAVLKNALDWIYLEWVRKPVTFVGYGNAGGARAIEQLREVAIEFQMAPIRHAVHLSRDVFLTTMKEPAPVPSALFAPAEPAAFAMRDELVWWANALREARRKTK